MKIAIHKKEGSYSDRWIEYCERYSISYKIVNCYNTNIIEEVKDCQGVLWHWNHLDYSAQKMAKQLTKSFEKMGKVVFPSHDTSWHYDDKIAQKYLLEAIGAPIIKTYVFNTKKDAYQWIEETTYPKVFKLSSGAGSTNVQLVDNRAKAKNLVNRAFGRGFPYYTKNAQMKERVWVFKRDRSFKSLIHVIKGIVRMVISKKAMHLLPRQNGYAYFQDYIPDCTYDDRIVVIGENVIAFRRFVRKNDFRASGSGNTEHNHLLYDKSIIARMRDIATELNVQAIAFDVIIRDGETQIIEISYCFPMMGETNNCDGYWDKSNNWHSAKVIPQNLMIEKLISEIEAKNASE